MDVVLFAIADCNAIKEIPKLEALATLQYCCPKFQSVPSLINLPDTGQINLPDAGQINLTLGLLSIGLLNGTDIVISGWKPTDTES